MSEIDRGYYEVCKEQRQKLRDGLGEAIANLDETALVLDDWAQWLREDFLSAIEVRDHAATIRQQITKLKEILKATEQGGQMRLSEAIRIGAMLKPQCFGNWFIDGGSCGLGAALDGSGFTLSRYDDFKAEFPILVMGNIDCPACERTALYIYDSIAHLNDDHHWTRGQIADFVELHEPDPMLPDTFLDTLDKPDGHQLWLEGYAERAL